MNSPKTINGITRRLHKQAFNGCVRDYIFETQYELNVSDFFNRAKPLVDEILEFLKFESEPVKICSTIKNEIDESNTLYAIKLEDYDFNEVIDELTKFFKDYEQHQITFYLNVTRYEPNLEFIINSDSDDSSQDCFGYHQRNEGSFGDESPLFVMNSRKWHEDDYDPNYNIYFY